MATSYKVSFLMVLVFACLIADFANASSIRVWSGPGCSGHKRSFHGCGCANVPHGFHGGYHFDYTGQRITVYNHHGCHNVHSRFHHDVSKCHHFGFKSVRLHC
ncbi:hypothetical protein C5167_025052 [Papaver somniferum]|uniref:Uncharacterized protein n=1 Tax=Papaver somniferum TaxID=3469 RepID=A0A4Y7JT80_PAPSO|nr:hypothetical protein C5167_025052 [Papaver somniferum]